MESTDWCQFVNSTLARVRGTVGRWLVTEALTIVRLYLALLLASNGHRCRASGDARVTHYRLNHLDANSRAGEPDAAGVTECVEIKAPTGLRSWPQEVRRWGGRIRLDSSSPCKLQIRVEHFCRLCAQPERQFSLQSLAQASRHILLRRPAKLRVLCVEVQVIGAKRRGCQTSKL
ncbi:hypothetical protein Q31a_24870 [Aureliella helgolandensis]|uniref:Uncharacterized protein n=1 Tax=Aureliella helgolandensis TaxID=2527968 RepID=A0A518G6F7_9BACT|nr:hypothetical protein Q31a_24870 [Aureliella helgolandensis]